MKDVLFVLVGVAVFASLLFGFLVFSMCGAHARVLFEKIKRELKEQGRYEEWANANRVLLISKAITNAGVWSGLPGFLFFNWLGYWQIGTALLGVFAICLVALMPINWILYNKIYQDLK
jgi:hypothetical protein